MSKHRYTDDTITAEERAFLLGLLDYEDYVNLFLKGVWYCTKKNIYNEKIEERFSLLDDILGEKMMADFWKYDEVATDKFSMIERIIEKMARIQKRFVSSE